MAGRLLMIVALGLAAFLVIFGLLSAVWWAIPPPR